MDALVDPDGLMLHHWQQKSDIETEFIEEVLQPYRNALRKLKKDWKKLVSRRVSSTKDCTCDLCEAFREDVEYLTEELFTTVRFESECQVYECAIGIA